MSYLVALLMFSALMFAFGNWRKGLFVAIVVAMLQDPIRKITPGQPAYYIILVGGVFGAVWLGAYLRKVPLNPRQIKGWNQQMTAPIALLLLLLLLQSVNSYARFDNFMLPAIGMLSYLTPVFALVIGYQFAIRGGMKSIVRWLSFYLMFALIMLISVYLQYVGLDWKMLGEVGSGMLITDAENILIAHSGFFRASEIAAWHASTAACFLFLIGTEKRFTFWRVAGALLCTAFLIGIGMLTGRRKMLVEISIFFMAYLFLLMLLRKNSQRFAVFFLLLGAIVYVGIVGMMSPDVGDRKYQINRYQMYVERSKSVFEAIPERINNLGIQPVIWAVDNFGYLGAGLGVASQGTQHFGGGAEVFGGAGEGGLGKITTELGVPGLILMIWLLGSLMQYIGQILKTVSKLSLRVSRFSYGMIAFLAANVAAFSVATQAYGDFFILIFLGVIFGFFLATPILAQRESQEQSKQAMATTGFKNGRSPYHLQMPASGAR